MKHIPFHLSAHIQSNGLGMLPSKLWKISMTVSDKISEESKQNIHDWIKIMFENAIFNWICCHRENLGLNCLQSDLMVHFVSSVAWWLSPDVMRERLWGNGMRQGEQAAVSLGVDGERKWDGFMTQTIQTEIDSNAFNGYECTTHKETANPI